MKKNRTLKLASGLLILCLITTCAISTTLAKYTTGGSVNDQARVAKWGVELTMDADHAFSNQYADAVNGLTVKSVDDANVVAPGTDSSEVAGGLRFAVTGTPEVAGRIIIDFQWTQDVYLRAMGGLRDWTAATKEEGGVLTYATFDNGSDYYPVVWTLTEVSRDGVATGTVLATGNLAAIKAKFDTLSETFAPNDNIAVEYELTWVWAFEVDNKADTYLGQLQAGLNPNALTEAVDNTLMNDYNLHIAYSLTMTVEQID